MYDIIGDIHGYADHLKALLLKMGYREVDGVWQHPDRKVIFLGDFIDRGPHQIASVDIPRAMIENGHALSVMGNHEFNAVAWVTPHPERKGEFLRKHNSRNKKGHAAFLTQVSDGGHNHQDITSWFKTLPLWLELDGLRVVHACWHPEMMATLRPYLDDDNRILPEAWPALTEKGTVPYEAAETVLKGLEISLPDGASFTDKDNNPRHNIRTRWWKRGKTLTYRDLAILDPSQIERIPHVPAPMHILPGYDDEKPLFVGHYWMNGTPAPLNPHIACLDYSIAADKPGADRKLCAYRWHGEKTIRQENLIWVDYSDAP